MMIFARLLLTAVFVFTGLELHAEEDGVVFDFRRPFEFTYLDWKDQTTATDGGVRIQAPKNAGGAGINIKRDLAVFAGRSPRLQLRINEGNQAEGINLSFSDADGTGHQFLYNLRGKPVGEPVELVPEEGAGLGSPNEIKDEGTVAGLALSQIRQFQLQGQWGRGQDKAIDITVVKLDLVEPDAPTLALRAALKERLAEEQARKMKVAEELANRKAIALSAGVSHSESGPVVEHVAPVAPDILAVTIHELKVEPAGQFPYEPQPGDEIRKQGDELLVIEDGKIVLQANDLSVWRKQDAGVRTLGDYASAAKVVRPADNVEGEAITEVTLAEPEAYRIQSDDDSNYATAMPPIAVYRKSKLTDLAYTSNQMPVRHHIFLKLTRPLQEGKSYTIEFKAVNTREPSITYRHEPTKVRSDAVHVSQIGYRPSDPYKRAYLSTWLGTGGALHMDPAGLKFHLLDAVSGKSMFDGVAQMAFPADQGEPSFKDKRNYSRTDVLFLDFSEFEQPGTYLVCVDGIGCSYPFEINEDVWRKVFETSMKGFLRQRSGIALGAPFTDYERPRDFHPEDGAKFVQLSIPFAGAQEDERKANLIELWNNGQGKLEPVTGVFGGYMDAGDWDTLSPHLYASYLNLDLLDLFPDYFEHVKLSLPPSEADNRLPDVLDEALWNLAGHRRLQLSSGAVRGGFGPAGGQRAGETSWQNSVVIGVYAADVESTLRYAGVAAKAARLLRKYDAKLADEYETSAISAWDWAQQQSLPQLPDKAIEYKAVASVELYWLTGRPAFHQAFQEVTTLQTNANDAVAQLDAIFAYARLPEDLGDADLKAKAHSALIGSAETALKFAEGNSFGLTSAIPGLPPMGFVSYFSVPEMVAQVLPRAHYVTQDPRYLKGALRAANYSAGANPDNMTYTVGVGVKHPLHPLHLDTRVSGQTPPFGVTVYGQSDPAENYPFNQWVHTWFIGKTSVPDSYSWPAAEAYIDLPIWPAMTEYTITQSIGPTSYYWGYLAARSDDSGTENNGTEKGETK